MTLGELFDGEPDGVWFAPGRVNLIGEHTDYNDGFVLPFALAQRTTVTARRLDRRRWTVRSGLTGETVEFGEDDLKPGAVTGWAAYVAGVVWVLRDVGHPVAGAQLSIESDVPLGAGLSSSAALECAVLETLVGLSGVDIPTAERPRLAQRAENDYAGMPCGILDQSAAVLCQAGNALFLDCRDLRAEQVPLDLAADGLTVLVIDTRAPHRHTDGEYAVRRASCEEAARALGVPALRDIGVDDLAGALAALPDDTTRRRVRHVVTENQRVLDTVALLRSGEMRAIGPLLTGSHASMRDDYEITVPQVDTAVQVALRAGAYGARMTGGGFGGCVLALVDADAAERVADAVRTAFATAGFAAPACFRAQPSPGSGPLL
ncbi:MAG: galactokinase [Actinocatenispora sp.]